MLFKQDIITVYRYIYLRIGNQCLRYGFGYGRHISQFDSFTTEESLFILITPFHEFGHIHFYHIRNMRRGMFRHNHVIGNHFPDTIHFFHFHAFLRTGNWEC